MKPIQLLIGMLSLAYASINLKAQTPSDTVKVSYKGKNYKVSPNRQPDEQERSTTWKFRDTIKKEMVIIKVTVKDDDKKDWDTESSSKEIDSTWEKFVNFKNGNPNKKDKFLRTYFVPSIDFGTASAFYDAGKGDGLNPQLRNSSYVGVTYIKQTMNIFKSRLLFSYGIGANNYTLNYAKKQQVQYLDKDGYLRTSIDSVSHYRKNRLNVSHVTVPILLEYHSKNNKFKIAAGVEFGFNGKSTFYQKGDRSEGKFKQTTQYNVKINPTQMNAVLKVGLDKITIYARYTTTDLYQSSAFTDGNNPHQHLFSVGICLFGI